MHANQEMPQYRCHKKVWALKIADITEMDTGDGACKITPADQEYPPFVTQVSYAKKCKASGSDMGYFVRYEDGYESWSPSEVFEDGYTPMVGFIGEVARVAHEVNRAYCQALGDDSQLPWKEAPDWQKKSAINGVDFHLENPDADPRSSHENWLKEKELDGWKWGPVKDVEKKEHPCYLPFDELPAKEKAKDFLFRAIVHALSE